MIVTPDTSAEALRSFLLASIPIEPSELVVIKTGALSASECLAAGRGTTWKLQAQLTDDSMPVTFHVVHKSKNLMIGPHFWPMVTLCKAQLEKKNCLVLNDFWNVIKLVDQWVYLHTGEWYDGGVKGETPLQRYYSANILEHSWSSWEPQQGQLVQTMDGSPALFVGASAGASGVFGSILLGETISQVPLFTLSPYEEE